MNRHSLPGVVSFLRHLAVATDGKMLSDVELVERFRSRRDELAFADLVRRHGPMVLATCRRILLNEHDAEDAFQAAFLVLAKRAATIRRDESLSGWLYQVTHRLALRARQLRLRRREQPLPRDVETIDPSSSSRLPSPIDDELSHLPHDYRSVVILCYLEGHTQLGAARILGTTAAAVNSRLKRARRLLRQRFARQGLGLAVLMAAAECRAVTDVQCARIVQNALGFAAGGTCKASALAITLAQGGLPMVGSGVRMLSALACLLGFILAGALMAPPPSGNGKDPPAFSGVVPEKKPEARAPRACIVIWLSGGPSQFDTFDPKPDDAEVRGPFNAIDTSVAGIKISEHLPNIAKQMNDLALIRSMTHQEGDHTRADYMMRTGHVYDAKIRRPTFGAVLAKELAQEKTSLPQYVCLSPRPFEAPAGYLGDRYAPLELQESPPVLPALEVFQEIDRVRAKQMRAAMGDVLDLGSEKGKVRDAYGHTAFGTNCLLARRMVQRGVTVVEITLAGWDTHENAAPALEKVSSVLDAGLSALISDLRENGLLETTLVVCTGEFGRTPRINVNDGRDHWSHCFTAVLAGGGIKGGQAIGQSNVDGSVQKRPVTVPELHATIYRALGVDLARIDRDQEIRLLEKGTEPVKELFAPQP